ncbi:MAG: hypothetical protein MSS56_01430 [Spirochaetia bacterium]|nr:hypothetical protein [Spirochaetia bacterium]
MKFAVAVLGSALLTIPLSADGDVLFSLYPHATVPLGSEKHSIEYGMGFGGSLAFKPIKYFSLNVFGDYMTLSLPNVKSISVLDGGAGASYHVPVSDRININAGLNIGAYRAQFNSTLSGITAGMNIGISYKINPVVSVDMAAKVSHYAAGNTALLNGMSAVPGITVNLSEMFGKKTSIRMETKEVKPVFPVLYSWYETNPFGTITITNEEDAKIQDVRVSFYQPQYMGHPNVCGVIDQLGKGESLDVNLTAFFNEHMLEMTEKNDTQAIINIEYTCLGQKRNCEYAMVVPVYGRNNMSWSDDRRASVFVSSKDPAAMWFAKYIASIAHENMRNGVPDNIQYAMAIFDTLDQFGLNYVIDPSSAFEDNVGTESIDFLQFPYQTLMYRGGDCDDISILVCSLFEAIGINTAFITIPGHIYMAFDSGLYKREAVEQFGSLDNFIVHGSEVWVPLEITLTDEGFNKAWRVGAREWKVAERNGTAALYKMRDSWQVYKPVNVPDARASFTLPDPDIVAKIFSHSVDEWILREIEPKIQGYNAILAKRKDDRIQNSLGALYARYGLFSQAEEQFRPLRRKGYMPAILNTANMYFAKKDYERAEKWYKEVLKKDRSNTLAFLGVARCCYELENYDECDLAYLKVRKMDEALASKYSYLGAFENKTGRAFNLADRLSHTIWQDDSSDAWKKEYRNLVAKKRAIDIELYGEDIVEMVQGEQDVDVPDYMKFNASALAIAPEAGVKEVPSESENKEGGDGKDPEDDSFEQDGFEFSSGEEYVGLPVQLEVAGPEGVLYDVAVVPPPKRDAKPAQKIEDSSIEIKNETVVAAASKVEIPEVQKPVGVNKAALVAAPVSAVKVAAVAVAAAPVEVAAAEEVVETAPAAPVEIEETEEQETGKAFDIAAADEEENLDELAEFEIDEIESGEFDIDEFLAVENDPVFEIPESTAAAVIVPAAPETAQNETAFDSKEEDLEGAPSPAIVPVMTQLPPVENIAVPRFTKQPSEEWANTEAYTAEVIPGMRPFEEEMGETENSKAYLYEDDVLAIDPDKDFGTVEKTKKVASADAPKTNPFSSYLSEKDAKAVEKITSYTFVPKTPAAVSKPIEAAASNTADEKPTEALASKSAEVAASNTTNEKPTPALASNTVEIAASNTADEKPTEAVASKAVEAAASNTADEKPAEVVASKSAEVAASNTADEKPAEAVASKAAEAAASNTAEEKPTPALASKAVEAAASNTADEKPAEAVASKSAEVAASNTADEKPAEIVASKAAETVPAEKEKLKTYSESRSPARKISIAALLLVLAAALGIAKKAQSSVKVKKECRG